MITFLTSSFIKYQKTDEYKAAPVDPSNGFTGNLKKYWKENSHFLLIPSDPADACMVDHVTREMLESFAMSGFSISEIRYFDDRVIDEISEKNKTERQTAARELLKAYVDWADVIFLAGGHAPTENAFIKECDLKGALGLDGSRKLFDGVYIGLSAGSVNSAQEAYLIPELDGESEDRDFVRFTDGLGITRIQMIPHIQYLRDVTLDGKKLINDIVGPDSMNKRFYMLPDGSYFIIRNGITELFGPAEVMENGQISKITPGVIYYDYELASGLSVRGRKYVQNIASSLFYDNYELIMSYNTGSGAVRIHYMSDFLLERGYVPVNYDGYWDVFTDFTGDFVVDDEKEPFLELISLKNVLYEIEKYGEYVVTVHIETEMGHDAEKVCIRAMDPEKTTLICTMTNVSSILDRDWMTDIFSRSGFMVEGERFLKYRDPDKNYSVVYTNIQGFKAINDIFGLHGGDMVIFHERDMIQETMEPVLLARFEADHYVFITETEKLTPENINRLSHQVHHEDFKEYPYITRLGIYQVKDNNNDLQHMVDRAKLAENTISSNRGITYAVYDEKMRMEYLDQRLLVSELDSALEAGEFKTYYQPVVDINTGEIVSAEALVRWHHHEQGLISPGRFVPAFEQRGLINKIDYLMVNNVLRFNSERKKQGLRYVPCAVNLSRVDFYDSRLIENIMQKLRASKDTGNMMKLEVTESAYVDLENNALDFLTEVKNMGMSVLLDDFGSGMSSMSTLESFEFDIVKLDMGFIHKIGKSKKAEAIIRSIIDLSHAIGARVVAEGVENEEQLQYLKTAGCDMIQGYYFYKPVSEEEFAALLQ